MAAKDSGKLKKMLNDAKVSHNLGGGAIQHQKPPKSNSVMRTYENDQSPIKYKNKFENEDSTSVGSG